MLEASSRTSWWALLYAVRVSTAAWSCASISSVGATSGSVELAARPTSPNMLLGDGDAGDGGVDLGQAVELLGQARHGGGVAHGRSGGDARRACEHEDGVRGVGRRVDGATGTCGLHVEPVQTAGGVLGGHHTRG